MTGDNMHTPTQEFRDGLEWEVRRAVRRERRLADERRTWRTSWTRAAAVITVSIAIGATATLASAQIRDGARRDSLLQSARAEAELAALRLQLAEQRAAEAAKMVQTGMATAQWLTGAQSELHSMQALAMRARLNIDEVTASAQPPRDDLNAPLVGGKDFVRDRLRLEAMTAQERLTAAEASLAEAERRVRIGAASDVSRLDADVEAARARAALGVLAKRLELRKEFVEKGTPADQMLRRLDELQSRVDADVAQRALTAARERVSIAEKQHAVGAVGDLDLMKAQVAMKERELDLQRAVERLKETPRAKPQ